MTMQRRHFVRMLGAGALAACPLCKGASAAESGHGTGLSKVAKAETGQKPAGHGGHSGWSYEGASGQIARFTKLYPANARPVQPLHRRFVLGNF